MSTKKVLILTSDTGGGHTSAARAIEAGFGIFTKQLSHLVHISRVIEESSVISRQTVRLYNFLLRNYQAYMKYYHWAIHKFNPDQSFARWFSSKYIAQMVDKMCPNLIVSVHPMVQHSIARVLEDLNLLDRIPLVTVVTDPCGNSWKGWANERVKLYLVAHDQARQELLSYGVKAEQIRICGMPIHPKFDQAEDLSQHDMRKELGLEPDRFTVFINAGWIGGGNIPKILSHMSSFDLDAQGIFLAGNNKKLEEEAHRIAARSRFPIKVIGYSDKMEQLMRAANVMVSKIGGLTTFEALACRLPIIMDHITPPMPQEAGTADLIANANAGIKLEHLIDIVPILQNLIEDHAQYLAMSAATQVLAIPNATQRVIKELSLMITPEPQIIEH